MAFAQQPLAPPDEARAHLQRHAADFGLSAADLDGLVVTDTYRSRRSGTTHVYLRQHLNDIPVLGGEFTVAIGRDGRVFHATGHGPALTSQRSLPTTPALSAAAAADAVARDAGLTPTAAFRVLSTEGGRSPVVTLSEAGIAREPVTARLVYHLGEDRSLALAWEVKLEERTAPHHWLGYVDATDGRVRARHDLIVHDAFGPAPSAGASMAPVAPPVPPTPLLVPTPGTATPEATAPEGPPAIVGTYTVYALPLESPVWGTPAPPGDARTSVSNPDDPTASPFGWHDTNGAAGAEFTTTQGNNVHAYTDTNNDNAPDPGSSPDGGAGLTFDFSADLSQDPSTYRPAAVTNLFYWNNVFHDVMYHYGFDEPAGNFQENNYGNGGVGGDYVLAEA
ncbi:MAG: M36 family metallopeptidase, partial [Rhodothermales bacterium]|nr:M36 family metallopeptidase [Rhodothermales bacterium]